MIDTAKRIVDRALKMGADEAEVFMIKSEGRGFTVEKNSISSLSGGLKKGIGIRLLKNKKLGFAHCTEEQKADSAIEQALSLSKMGKESEFIFPEPDKPRNIENIYDDKLLEYSAEDAMEGVLSAKAAGCYCIGIPAPNTPPQDLSKADIVLNSLSEISQEVLDKLK